MVETQQLIWVPELSVWKEQLIATLNPAFILNQGVYVSKTGSDDTGNGSMGSPFLTIPYALSVIKGAGPDSRYVVYVEPGEYSEPWQIKPWVSIFGIKGSNGVTPNGSMLVEITAPADTLGFSPEWTIPELSVAWMNGLGFQNHQTWNQSSRPGMQPQLNFDGCSFNMGVKMTEMIGNPLSLLGSAVLEQMKLE